MSTGRNRFYKDVSVRENEGGFSVLLDGKPIRTPAGAAFAVPTSPLAEAIAVEWRGQGEKIRSETMPLAKLANTAIDRIASGRSLAADQILAFAKSDLLCYRADSPSDLVERQRREWDPLLEWALTRHGAGLRLAAGISFVEQPEDALKALERAIAVHDDFSLAGLHSGATLTGSAVIALALAEGRLSAAEAFAKAQLDEIYQAEKWGRDSEAENLAQAKAGELFEIERYFSFLRLS